MARIAGITREQTEEKILNAALHCLANLGDKETTFRTIATRAGVSPALVGFHFKSRSEVFPKVLDYVIKTGRATTSSAVEEAKSPVEKLRAYFRVSVEFFRSTPDRAKVYLQLYHVATFDQHFRGICKEVKEVAVRRVEAILEAGEKSGDFEIKNRALTARIIHTNVIGLLLSVITTEQDYPDSVLLQQFESTIFKGILASARSSS